MLHTVLASDGVILEASGRQTAERFAKRRQDEVMNVHRSAPRSSSLVNATVAR